MSTDKELYKLELLSLVSRVSQELFNHTKLQDKNLAEFVISVSLTASTLACQCLTHPQLHEQSKTINVFQSKLKDIGADFPDTFVKNLDRMIVAMHPKYKRKAAKLKISKAKALGSTASGLVPGEKDMQSRKFPGLSLPDVEWRPAEDYLDGRAQKESEIEKLPDSISMDNTMAELAAVAARRNRPAAEDYLGDQPPPKRPRSSSMDRDRDSGYEGMRPRRSGASGYGTHPSEDHRGRFSTSTLDERPILYKIYPAHITNVRDFGAFASLEGVRGRIEGESSDDKREVPSDTYAGLIHVSNLTGQRVSSASDVIKRSENVKVKVMSIAGTKIGLSLKDVDQRTGADLSYV